MNKKWEYSNFNEEKVKEITILLKKICLKVN